LALSIVRGSIEDIDSLEPLWVGVHHVHAASMPELAPYVSDAETWSERRALYVSLFDKPDTELLGAVEHELAKERLDDVIRGVLPGNEVALRLYERRGFRPTWMYMSRFAGR
jgi:hypothetical protein